MPNFSLPPEFPEGCRAAEVQWATDEGYEEAERQAIEHEDELPYIEFGTEVYDRTGFYWDLLSDADRQRLTSSHTQKRCVWCGGIGHHAKDCFGQPRMPWGKHKNQPLSAVPERYLTFCLRKRFGRAEHIKTILNELQRRYVKYRAPEWEQILETNAVGTSE